MIRQLSFAAFALICGTAAVGSPDKRIRTLAYAPDQIVQVLGRSGIQSTIEFAPDERIENVAVGDSSAWQITPNHRASLLFVKPLVARSRTNMTVVTDHRTYMFDLVAGDKWTTPLYALKFSYPRDKEAETPKTEQHIAAAPPAQPSAEMTAAKLHFDWNTKGNGKLLPNRVFDDGSSVYLAWEKETPLPAILTVSEDRKEGPVNYRMDGEYIVVSPVPANLVLRYGSKYALLWPSHATSPRQVTSPSAVGGRQAATRNVAQPAQQTDVQQSAVQPSVQTPGEPAQSAIKFANMTSLYSDKLTDTQHER